MSTVLTLAPQTETTSLPVRRPAPRSGSPRRRTPADPGERRIWLILLGTLVLAAFCVGMFLQQPRFRHTDTPISEIQLGANVPGSNPSEADDLTFGDSIDPNFWKMVRLTAQQGDGTLVEISLLRPDSWLAERNAVAGSVVDGLEFGRLGVVGDATVETISPCPPIRPGPGRTVTGIYKHFGQQVLDLRTANGEEIGVTPDHRFWSADRREFVQAGDLHPGETLNLLDGTTTVTSITQRPSGEPVYTLEVHVEHVFHVAKSGVLVHNCNVPSARTTHDVFLNKVRPGARERIFETPWSSGKGLGSRKFDDFDVRTGTGFEANTTPWSKMTQQQLSRKLDQVGSDFALLKTNPDVKRVVWFGTEELPLTGLGGQLRDALKNAGIEYWVVNP